MKRPRRVLDKVYLIDTEQFSVPEYGGVYVLAAEQPALVDTGTSLAEDKVLTGLADLGIPKAKVQWLFLTHVHLDHAGGAGVLLPQFPRAKVVVHERGARHLVDPTKLLASIKEATKKMAPHYGTVVPLPQERIRKASDGELFDLGDMRIRVIGSPGHAPHHLCYFEEHARVLFAGDAAGLWRRGKLLPATVPPQFDLEANLETLARLEHLVPAHLLYAHFGPASDAQAKLRAYADLLKWWVERVAEMLHTIGEEDQVVAELLADPELKGWPYNETNPWEELAMSARGVIVYLRREGKGT